MYTKTRVSILVTALALMATGQVQASLLLDASVTSQFSGGVTTTVPDLNVFPEPRPATLYFGQLQATTAGSVDFYYVGNEAGFTNTFNYGANSYSTADKPDVFTAPHVLIGSIDVLAGSFLDFGFCTSGGDDVSGAGFCADNDGSTSLAQQFNHAGIEGYRSIGFSSMSAYDPASGSRTFNGNPGISDLWMIFWDDSGNRNDDDHNDMVVGARFRPVTTVPEPGTLSVFALGLLAGAFALRRQAALIAKR